MEKLNSIPFQSYMAIFKQLSEITDIASMSKEDRIRYDESIKIYRDNLATIEFAEKKAREEGREEERIAIARSLKSKQMDATEIANITGLTLNQVNDL